MAKLSERLDLSNLDVQDLNKVNLLAKYLGGDSKPAIYYLAIPQ